MKGQQKTPAEAIREDSASTGASIENLSNRVTRYGQGKETALEIKKYIEHTKNQYTGKPYQKMRKAVDRLGNCGNFLDFRHYYTIDEVKLAQANFCKQHLLCPLCAMRRGAKQALQGYEKISYLMAQNPRLKAALVTLTIKDGPDLGERVNHLMSGKKKVTYLMQNSKKRKKVTSEFAKILGFAGAIEIGIGKGSKLWHPHIHMIVLYEEDFLPLRDDRGRIVTRWDSRRQVRVPQLLLSKEWERITVDSYILDVSPLRPGNLQKDLCEVYKYALKFSLMTPEKVVEAWLTLSGRNLVFSAGILRGVEVVKDLIDEIPYDYDSLPYIEYLYRYLNGAGYSLAETKRVEK